jgi:biopolymer transport protein ExbB
MEGEEQLLDEGLGLAEAAGLTDQVPALEHFNFMESFWSYFQSDLISSIPITICSFLLIAVLIERSMFYAKNNRDISIFIHNLQTQLEKGNLEAAQMLSSQLGSVTGEVAEEGVRLLAVQREDFSRAYDITTSIVTRKLQKYLPILATIGAVAPFLGLFGTVSGVIKALFRMSLGSEGASLKMIGEISNALIATGYGLFIAIIAVVSYNLFSNIVKRYNDDFMLLKLLFLSFSNVDFDTSRIYASSREEMQAPGQEYYAQSMQQAQQAPSTADILNNARRPKDIQGGEKPPYPDFLK